MMLKTIGLSVLCAWAVTQVAWAQDDAEVGLLTPLVPSEPVAVVTQKPVQAKAPAALAPLSVKKPTVPAPTPGELNALAVRPPATPQKTVVPVAPAVKPPEVKPPAMTVPVVPTVKPVAPVTPVVKPPEVKEAVTPAAAKPTLTLKQPKKRTGGAGFLNQVSTATNTVQRETKITSKKMDFDNREGVLLFDDNVLVDDPQFFMRTDRLLVFMEKTNDVSQVKDASQVSEASQMNEVSQVMAIGNVTFSNGMHSATCNKAVYTRKDGQIVMTGDVHLKSEGKTAGDVYGNRVVIGVDDERVEVLEGATITLPPGVFKKASEQK